MTDLLTILIALIIIIVVIGFFGFLATKINMSDPLSQIETNQPIETKRKEKNSNDQSKKKRKEQKKPKRENKEDEEKQQQQQRNKPSQVREETDDEREESEQEQVNAPVQTTETSSKARKRNKNKAVTNEANPSTRVPPTTHPKSASKDETDFSRQQTKGQSTAKQAATKKTTTATAQPAEKTSHVQEQPFTVVGGNRHKNSAAQPQQNKTVNTVAPSAPVQHEQLPQRQQQQPLPVKETTTPTPVPVKQTPTTTTSVPVKQTPVAAPPKVADLIKGLPSSQAVVTELMSALDAFPLSADELEIIMHKIANKQSVVNQDWSKLQQGQKVDPQAHIGQVLDESARAYQDDLKTNSIQRLKELTDNLNEEKRRNNDLLKEKTSKDREIQLLHAQLDSLQQKAPSNPSAQSQQKLHTLELQVQRLTEENLRLNQQQSTPSSDSSNVQLQVLSEQIRKLSVDNANLERKLQSNEFLVRESQKERDDLIRYNEQLTQSLRNAEKDLKSIEANHHQQLNETRTLTLNEINEYKNRIQQLQNENEQLKREEIVHVEPPPTDIQTITVNSEEREQFEKEIQEYKQTIENLQSQENDLKQEIQRLRQVDWNDVKVQFSQLLPETLRSQLSNDNQDFNQWLSSYRQLTETNQRNVQEQSTSLRNENERLQKNMTDIENQLKDIEKTVQTKEETLLHELQNKDSVLENLNQEIQRLQTEFQNLQTAHDASVGEARSLKAQLDERSLPATANTPSIITADESFELIKQPTPSLSPIVVDVRAEQLNELIRSNDMQQAGHGETSAESTSTDQQS